MNSQRSRTVGAAFVLLQGLVTALFPQMSIRFVRRMIGKNFENASELTAKPAYLQQLRATGVGMVAAAGTDLLLVSLGGSDADSSEPTGPEAGTGEDAD